MRLSDVKTGSFFYIRSLPPGNIRMQAIRLGFRPGAEARCLSKLKKGPVVVVAADQEIACGRRLAEQITVSRFRQTASTDSRFRQTTARTGGETKQHETVIQNGRKERYHG